MAYALPGVKPNVRQCAEDIGPRFGIRTIYGVGARANASDHPKGLALDFMCDVATGRRLRAALIANWNRYGITYIIHEQKILNSPTGQWESMADRGSVTANHFDHVHTSFKNTAVSGSYNSITAPDGTQIYSDLDGDGLDDSTGVPMPDGTVQNIPGLIDSSPVGQLISFISDADNWKRVALFIAGLAAILIALYPMLKGVTGAR